MTLPISRSSDVPRAVAWGAAIALAGGPAIYTLLPHLPFVVELTAAQAVWSDGKKLRDPLIGPLMLAVLPLAAVAVFVAGRGWTLPKAVWLAVATVTRGVDALLESLSQRPLPAMEFVVAVVLINLGLHLIGIDLNWGHTILAAGVVAGAALLVARDRDRLRARRAIAVLGYAAVVWAVLRFAPLWGLPAGICAQVPDRSSSPARSSSWPEPLRSRDTGACVRRRPISSVR